ncbi:hypothetical protein ACSL103130_02785 [Actinomyces slackii]|uniref:Uncharacterized protein n=1 Tax=Actinomyces slackii TaxID=52774 RepID=A0A448KE85_9ACTO|nr:hypothetical protein [Actinomyces slackii]VEG75222.1 Uncharacterised protein [Actinomyces slackii]
MGGSLEYLDPPRIAASADTSGLGQEIQPLPLSSAGEVVLTVDDLMFLRIGYRSGQALVAVGPRRTPAHLGGSCRSPGIWTAVT